MTNTAREELARLGGISRRDPHNAERIAEQRARVEQAFAQERRDRARARRDDLRKRIGSDLPNMPAEDIERLVEITADSLFDFWGQS